MLMRNHRNWKNTLATLETGKILVAEPFLADEYFKRSVIFIADYHPTGTVGFVLNRPMRVNIKRLISDFPDFPGTVYMGGPVEHESIHYIHKVGHLIDGGKEIAPGIFWGGNFNQLKVLISKGLIEPKDIRFFVGYSGWSPGQLEGEITETNSWLIEDGDANYVFHSDESTDLWKQIMDNKGSNFSVMASHPDSLNYN